MDVADASNSFSDQYTVTAFLVVDGDVKHQRVMHHGNVRVDAEEHDISAYVDTDWTVILEHARVDASSTVIEQVSARVLYPTTVNIRTTFDS
jgi:hypothetical protein